MKSRQLLLLSAPGQFPGDTNRIPIPYQVWDKLSAGWRLPRLKVLAMGIDKKGVLQLKDSF
jgi:hypothetical protein